MWLLNIKRKASSAAKLSPAEKTLFSKIARINARGECISPELYQQLRDFEVAWLERNYDFNSLQGINSIPVRKNLPGAPAPGNSVGSHTGEVYYHLRRKAYFYEDRGDMALALACMRKSVALAMRRNFCTVDDCYPLVKMLARAGHIEEAYSEKSTIDKRFDQITSANQVSSRNHTPKSVTTADTDLVIMDAHGSTCPICAIYQGRVYSISGKNRKFPKVPDFYYTTGLPHGGCSHNFWPYIDGVSSPDLEYTLEVHPLKNKQYGRNIVVFSNRPFVDDRTEYCKQAAVAVWQKEAEARAKKQYYEDHMIEIEAKRGCEHRDYLWIQENLPDKCPKSLSGFRRMKTQNTKNFQQLQRLAAEKGRNI